MIWAILTGMLGVTATGIGALAMLMAFMPKFGGGNDAWAFPFGLVLFGVGLALMFFAGSLT